MAKTAYEKALEKQQRENQKSPSKRLVVNTPPLLSAANLSLVECALWMPHRKKFSLHF